MSKRRASHAKGRATARSAARLEAVQALYQMDMAGTDLTDVVAQFTDQVLERLSEGEDGVELAPPDQAFFEDLVTGVVRLQKKIDPLVDTQLAKGWRLTRVDSILRAILRAGCYELMGREDVPTKVVISEYIDIARAFFDDDEPKVVNGVLDHLGRTLRASDFSGQENV